MLEAPEEDGGGEGLFAASSEWRIPAAVLELVRDPSVLLVGYDLKREYHVLSAQGAVPARAGFDTMLAAYVLNPGRSNYRLEDLAREYLGRGIPAADPGELLAHEVAAAAALWQPMADRLKRDDLEKVYYELELPLIAILAQMESLGVGVDCAELKRLSGRLAARVADLEARAHEAAKQPNNHNTPKQLQEILFTQLSLPAGK